MNRRVEHPRGGENDDVALYWPDHFAPMTWRRCTVDGCSVRVDPWDGKARCKRHRDAPVDLDHVRQLVDAGRRQGAADAYRRRYPDG